MRPLLPIALLGLSVLAACGDRGSPPAESSESALATARRLRMDRAAALATAARSALDAGEIARAFELAQGASNLSDEQRVTDAVASVLAHPVQPIRTLASCESPVTALAWSADGATVAAGSDTGCLVMASLTGDHVDVDRDDARSAVRHLAFAKGRARVLVITEDGALRTWKPPDFLTVMEGPGGDAVSCAAWSPGGERILAGMQSGKVVVFDAFRREMGQHEEAVQAIAFSKDGQAVTTHCVDGTSRLWASDGTFRAAPAEKASSPIAELSGDRVELNEGGATLQRATEPPRTFRVIDAASRAVSAAVAPRGDALAIGLADGRVTLWRLQ